MRSFALDGPIRRGSRWVPCGARDQAEQDLGLAELGVVGGDPVVGAERQFAAAAQGVPGDGRDDRLGDAGDGGERLLEAAGARDHRRVVHLPHLLDVGPGREDLLAAVEDHGAYVVAVGHLLGEGLETVLDGDVQGVHRRAVEPDGADAVGDVEMHSHGGQAIGRPAGPIRTPKNADGPRPGRRPGPVCGTEGQRLGCGFHFSQSRFQALSPFHHWIFLSSEFLTTTTSPIIELS